jgi:hypothetical protein
VTGIIFLIIPENKKACQEGNGGKLGGGILVKARMLEYHSSLLTPSSVRFSRQILRGAFAGGTKSHPNLISTGKKG